MTGPAPYPPELTISQLADICDLSKATISHYIAEGLITVYRLPNNTVAIPVKGLDFLPPAGDRLLAPATIYLRSYVTRHQLGYARRRGDLPCVQLPGGGYYRFLESEIGRRYGWRAGR